uniref:Testis-expressed sequence 264 protein n=1 Tax=Strigamia maritima TaxID=126957 RepID=T1IT36_STRMM
MEAELNLVLAILGVLLLLFLTIFGLLVHSGLFTKFEIRAGKPPFDNLLVAYRFARGPYKNAGNLFTEVHLLAPSLKTIGVYYDDPQEVSSSDLRFIVGAVLDDSDDEKSKENEKILLDQGYKLITFPAVSNAITTTFPFKNTLSIFIAVSRVYPQLNEFIKVRSLCAHPMIEVYDKGTIVFVAPLARQDEFYVPE